MEEIKKLDYTIEDSVGCTIHDKNWDKEELDKFLVGDWKIKCKGLDE